MKKYELQHQHRGKWWGLGERTAEQVKALLSVADTIERIENGYIIKLTKLFFNEPIFKAIERK